MTNLNHITIAGNLTRDFETRQHDGTQIAENCLAHNSGTREKEHTDFIELTFWGKQAESAAQHLAKGRRVIIEGRLAIDTWDDKETGKRREKTRIKVLRWHFGDSKPQEGAGF